MDHDEVDQNESVLSRDLTEFLVEFSIALHRFAMYPQGHPSLEPAISRVFGRLPLLLTDRDRLTFGVGLEELVVDGITTDPKHPVISDLARRLHAHQLAALWFAPGIELAELEDVLRSLGIEPERGGEPLGSEREGAELPEWSHAGVVPIGYDRLVLGDSGEDIRTRSGSLWSSLAAVVMENASSPGSAADDPTSSSQPDGESLATVIQAGMGDEQVVAIAGYLGALTTELKGELGGGDQEVRHEVTKLIRSLDEESLDRLLAFGGDRARRDRFLYDAADSLEVGGVIKILETAARANEQTISNSMARLLSKLARHSEAGPSVLRRQADSALRGQVENLIHDWTLEDPNPEGYTALLNAIAKEDLDSPVRREIEEDDPMTGARRLVEMALELDVFGPSVENAVTTLIDDGMGRLLVERVTETRNGVAEEIWQLLATPEMLSELLTQDEVDPWTLSQVVGHFGSAAIEPLLGVLTESDSRAVRRVVFDVLSMMGEEVAVAIRNRLDDERWFVVRNMLALLNSLGTLPKGVDPATFVWHPDHRVRRQALSLAMKDSRRRDWALAEAISSEDERLVRMGLNEVQARVPETLVPTIVNRVLKSEHVPELRALGARALATSRSVLARDALIELTGEKSVFGRPKITGNSADVIAGIEVLVLNWRGDQEVERLLSAAMKSKDDDVRSAASGDAVHEA